MPRNDRKTSMPDWMKSWGEDDQGREYAEAVAKGERAYQRLMDRRYRREQAYWAPIRAAQEEARRKAVQEAVEQERADKAAYMREYRAQKATIRAQVDAERSSR